MTGGTLIIRLDDTYTMTKVAHDGYDMKEKIGQFKQWVANKMSPIDIVVAYLRGRGGIDFEPRDVMDDKQVQDCFIVRQYSNSDFPEAQNQMEDEINEAIEEDEETYDEDHPYFALGCSYSDYELYIDLNTNKFFLNGEEAV